MVQVQGRFQAHCCNQLPRGRCWKDWPMVRVRQWSLHATIQARTVQPPTLSCGCFLGKASPSVVGKCHKSEIMTHVRSQTSRPTCNMYLCESNLISSRHVQSCKSQRVLTLLRSLSERFLMFIPHSADAPLLKCAWEKSHFIGFTMFHHASLCVTMLHHASPLKMIAFGLGGSERSSERVTPFGTQHTNESGWWF